MDHFALHLLWCSVQVTLVLAATALVYLLLWRRGPAGSFVVMTGLVLVLGLSLLLWSPWPRWTSAAVQNWTAQRALSPARVGPGDSSARPEDVVAGAPPARVASADSEASAFDLPNFLAPLPATGAGVAQVSEQTRSIVPWRKRAAWVFLGLFALGGVGMVLGLFAVRRYCRGSRAIDDRELCELLDILWTRLSGRRRVEVRLSPELATPATVGWLRPIVLLPENYHGWTRQERTAVLAHELAHIRHHDFAFCCLAQVARVLHFYHPLMHWLVDRLRLEQELAADATAARVAGGREIYLRTLAEMALRQTGRGIAWPARSFLPTRKTFLRRIEMLRDARSVQGDSGHRRRLAGGALLLAAAVIAVGLRPPSPSRAEAAPLRQGDSAAGQAAMHLPPLPRDTVGLIAVRPQALLQRDDMQAFTAALTMKDTPKPFGMELDELEQITWVITPPLAPKARSQRFISPLGTLVLRAVAASDFSAAIDRLAPDAEAVRYGSHTYHKSAQLRDSATCYFRLDAQTLVIDDEASIRKFLDTTLQSQPNLVKSAVWEKLNDGFAAMAFESAAVRELLRQAEDKAEKSGRGWPPAVSAGAPLWQDTTYLGIGIASRENLELTVACETSDAANLSRVQDTLKAQTVLARNILEQVARPLGNAPPGLGQVGQQAAIELSRALSSAGFDAEDRVLTMRAEIDPGNFVGATLADSIMKARAAAHRAVGMNNLKQIGLAMHNYSAANGHFPPAVLTSDDGKTKYSWRVALLPYLDQQALYDEYRFDQPWDSEANRKVLGKMPAIYRAPTAPKEITNSSYFVFTGGGSLFSGTEGTEFGRVKDGLSNTALAVEAQRGIPWTKPEDIPFDPQEELPEVGGYFPDGFCLLLADGSVRFLGTPVNAAVFRAIITMAGREVIDWEKL